MLRLLLVFIVGSVSVVIYGFIFIVLAFATMPYWGFILGLAQGLLSKLIQ